MARQTRFDKLTANGGWFSWNDLLVTQLGVGGKQCLVQVAALECQARRLDAEATLLASQHGFGAGQRRSAIKVFQGGTVAVGAAEFKHGFDAAIDQASRRIYLLEVA